MPEPSRETAIVTDSFTERRRFSRVPFDAVCQLQGREGGETREVHLVDISLRGALIEATTDLEMVPGDTAELRLRLGEDIQICMLCTLAHVEGLHYGLRVDDMELDSLTHLRRLVELNLADETLLERDLEAMFPPQA